jgi:hypothetical protein
MALIAAWFSAMTLFSMCFHSGSFGRTPIVIP